MSTTIAKRKRARKACIPCHQRKRKCDAQYPCNMCSTYEYDCEYADDNSSGAIRSAEYSLAPAKRVDVNGQSGATRQAIAVSRSTDRYDRQPVTQALEAECPTRSPTVMTSTPVASTRPVDILNAPKSKFAGSTAAMAFPHILGTAFGSDSPPKVHPYAYNFGTRPEEVSNSHEFLGQLILESDVDFYSGVYFSVLARVGDVIDPRIYAQRTRDYYHGSGSTAIAFGAVAASIVALGSFLSRKRHPRESDLVKYAKAILDDPASMRILQVDHIIAWGLRVLYLRATSRPNNAWIASCTCMHLCEALGLHEEENINKISSTDGAAALGHDVDQLRRIFWILWAGHNLLSYEYDRSSVHLRAVTCQAINPASRSVASLFVQLAQIIPAPNSPFHLESQPSSLMEELFERLKALEKLHVTDPFLVVTKADITFCFYRRIYQLKMGISQEIVQVVIDSGNAAVKAAEQLLSQGCLFWNVIGSVFQYTCVLLAMDTLAASAHIAAAFEGLKNLVEAADTGLTREALSVAQRLLSLNIAKKRKELDQLETLEASCEAFQSQPGLETTSPLPDTDWNLDWDQFLLEPFLPIFSGDV